MIYNTKPDNFNPSAEKIYILIEYDKKLLFLHRSYTNFDGNKWDLPCEDIGYLEKYKKSLSEYLKLVFDINIESKDIEHIQTFFVQKDNYSYTSKIYKAKIHILPTINLRENYDGYEWFSPHESIYLNLNEDLEAYIKILYLF